MALFLVFVDTLGRYPRGLCGRIALVSKFPPQICLKFPQKFAVFPQNRLGFRRFYILKHTVSLLGSLQQSNRSFTTTFLRLLAGLTVNFCVPEFALLTEFASRLCFVMLTIREGCQKNT